MFNALETKKTHSMVTSKADIYSLGLLACWLMTEEVPDINDIKSQTIEFPGEYTMEMIDFAYYCMVRDPQERPDIG